MFEVCSLLKRKLMKKQRKTFARITVFELWKFLLREKLSENLMNFGAFLLLWKNCFRWLRAWEIIFNCNARVSSWFKLSFENPTSESTILRTLEKAIFSSLAEVHSSNKPGKSFHLPIYSNKKTVQSIQEVNMILNRGKEAFMM